MRRGGQASSDRTGVTPGVARCSGAGVTVIGIDVVGTGPQSEMRMSGLPHNRMVQAALCRPYTTMAYNSA